MSRPVGMLVVLALVCITEASAGPSSNPVEGVIKLIERLEKKIQAEGKAEAAAYDKFACFCKEQADEKLFSITKKTGQIAELAASIKKCTATIEDSTAIMQAAQTRKADLEAENKAATAARKKEHADFQLSKDDLIQGINEILKAQEEVKASAEKQAGFVQLSESTLAVVAGAEGADPGDAKAYAFKGGETLKTLEKLHKEFKGKLKKLMEEEAENKHTHDMAEGARNNEIMAKGDLIIKSQNIIGEKSKQKGEEEKTKGDLETDKQEDQEYLDKVTDECEDKAVKWDARSKRRVNELTAISECLGILKGDAVGKYGSNKLALAQSHAHQISRHNSGHWVWKSDVSFLQVSSDSRKVPAATKKVISHLAERASLLRSSTLETLVMQLQENPFESVKTMIEDLITKIDDEQAAEEDEIEDCKNDITDNTKKRAKNAAKMEEEEATIVEETAAIDVHKENALNLGKDISELSAALNEATQLRAKEKKENEQTLADARLGLDSMTRAIKVLKEFYDSEMESLVQTGMKKKEPEIPELESSGFLGEEGSDADISKQGEAQGIFGLLGTIKSDYETTIENTEKDEQDAETEYNDYKAATDADMADKQKQKSNEEKSSRQAATDSEQAKEDLAQWTKQKAEAEYELSILTPRCLGLGASAEERKKRREEEKKALQDAITILDTMGPAQAPEPSEEFLQKRS